MAVERFPTGGSWDSLQIHGGTDRHFWRKLEVGQKKEDGVGSRTTTVVFGGGGINFARFCPLSLASPAQSAGLEAVGGRCVSVTFERGSLE